ncbi:MAG: competence protein ComA [Phototrophicales bacterium]|nr:MAG: competence protein ComA [Phototrophicales bacterium]
MLKRRQLTLCTAESCTGGLIASCITDVAGSSAYMLGGVVAYANEIKQQLLHVRIETLRAYGAVSEQTAIEMAQGALSLFHADYALSVTGIAGPGGGTPEKPVGLTYIGLAGRDGTLQVERYVWQGDRQANKQQSVQAALNLLLRVLQAPQN